MSALLVVDPLGWTTSLTHRCLGVANCGRTFESTFFGKALPSSRSVQGTSSQLSARNCSGPSVCPVVGFSKAVKANPSSLASSRLGCFSPGSTRLGFCEGSGSKQQGFLEPHWLVRKGRRKQATCCSALSGASAVHAAKSRLIASVQTPTWIPTIPRSGFYRDLTFASIGAGFALLVAIFIGQWWTSQNLAMFNYRASDKVTTIPEPGPTGQKESVEWVNMVVGKMWKIYRRSVENWIVDILQPAIDRLAKPEYIDRIEVAELNLDYEPLAFRNVQRITSRRANDLQYHIGLRYTGDARCLLNLHLKASAFGTNVPVGVYDLDVDAELWVKIRLAPIAPYIGTVSLAFVRLPTIKLVLAPFRLVNLFAVPFLSSFLTKLLTIDLPNLYVLPRRINFDIIPQEHSFASHIVEAVRIGPNSAASEPTIATTEGFKGELTVTLCEAQNLPIGGLIGWSNPYCTLAIGEQWVESKKNSETSHPSGHKNPVWNQDFQFLVSNPGRQHVKVYVRDSHLTFSPNIGFCEVPIWKLRDCVPTDVWVPLKREGPFGIRRVAGSVRLLLTYKSFVDDDSEPGTEPTDGSCQTIKIYSEGESEEAAMEAATTAAKNAEDQVTDGKKAGFAEASASDTKTGLETGRAVAEVTQFQTRGAASSNLPPSKARKLAHETKDAGLENRYAAGDLSEGDEVPDSKTSASEEWSGSGEQGWASLVTEVVSKIREMGGEIEGVARKGRKKKVVVRALGEKRDGEDADGAIWTEVSEKETSTSGRNRAENSDDNGAGNGHNGRAKVLGSGIGTIKEDGAMDVMPTGDDVTARFEEFFEGGGEMLDERGRPTRWSKEVREFVEKGGYENGAEAIQAKKQEAKWKGTREFLERWGRENGNGDGNGTGSSVSGRGRVGVLENGRFVKFFEGRNGHISGGEDGGHSSSENGATGRISSNGKSEEGPHRGELLNAVGHGNGARERSEELEWEGERRGRTAVLERSVPGGSGRSEKGVKEEKASKPHVTVSKEGDAVVKGQVNPVGLVLTAMAIAALLWWGHLQALKVALLPLL